MKPNNVNFTDREAMIIRETLWDTLEKLHHSPEEVFVTGFMTDANVTRDEHTQVLEKLWDTLQNNYPKSTKEDKLAVLHQRVRNYNINHKILGICQNQDEMQELLNQSGVTLTNEQVMELWQLQTLDLFTDEITALHLPEVSSHCDYFQLEVEQPVYKVLEEWCDEYILPAQLLVFDRYEGIVNNDKCAIDVMHQTYGLFDAHQNVYTPIYVLDDTVAGQIQEALDMYADEQLDNDTEPRQLEIQIKENKILKY